MRRRPGIGGLVFALLVVLTVGTARALPVRVPSVIVTDDTADPFRTGEPRGAIYTIRYDLSAVVVASSADGLVDPVATAMRGDRKLYVLDRSADPLLLGRPAGAVFLVDPPVPQSEAVVEPILASPLFQNPVDIAIDPDGRILVLDSDADPFEYGTLPGALFRGDPSSGNFQVLASEPFFREPISIAFDLDGSLLVIDRLADPLGVGGTPGALFRVSPATGAVTLIKAFDAARLPNPRAVVVLPAGDYLIVDSDADPSGFQDGRGAVFRLSRTTGELTTFLDEPFFREPIDVVLGESGQVWVLDIEADPDGSVSSVGAVFRFDLATGIRTYVQNSTLFRSPMSLAFAAGPDLSESDVVWKDETGGVIEPGNLVTVRATLRSLGTEDVVGAVLLDTLGTEWTFVAGTDSVGTGQFSYDPATRILRWEGDVPLGLDEVVRYRLRAAGTLEAGDPIFDRVVVRVGPVAETFTYESVAGQSFVPGTVVFVDQGRVQNEPVGLILAVQPGNLSPETVHVGAPLVEPTDAVFLEDGILAILDLKAVPEQGVGDQAVLLFDRGSGEFEVLWSREAGDGLVAPSGIALHPDGSILLVDRESNPFDLPFEPDILGRDFGPGAVYRIPRETGRIEAWFSDPRMREPVDLEVADDGTVVVVDFTGVTGVGDLWEYNPSTGNVLRRFLNSTWFRDPLGIALDGNRVYVADATHFNDENEDPVVDNGTLLLVNRTNPTTYAILSQSGLLVDPSDCFLSEDGYIYVTDRDANPRRLDVTDPGAVFRYDPGNGVLEVVAADFGIRRPDGPTGLGVAQLEAANVNLTDLNAGAVVPGDTLEYSIKVRNTSEQGIPEVLVEIEVGETLQILSCQADFGEVYVAPSLGRASWVGRIAGGDTLQVSGRSEVREGFGFGTPVVVRARVDGVGEPQIREATRKLAAPFQPGTLLLADESADPRGVGGQPGAVFDLSGPQSPVSVLLDGFPFRDPVALEFTSGGDLLIADRLASEPGAIFRLQTSTGAIQSITSGDNRILSPVDLAAAIGGDVLFTDRDADSDPDAPGRGVVFRLPGGNGPAEIFSEAPVFRSPAQLAQLPDGRLFLTDRQADPEERGGNTAAIFQLDPASGAVLSSWQFAELREPTGLTPFQDTLLLVTDFIANPRNFPSATGALYTFDPDEGTIAEYLASNRLVSPYRSFPQVDGRVLVVDQAAAAPGQSGFPGLVFEWDPVARTLRDFAFSDSFQVPSDLAELRTSFTRFRSYEVADENGAPLYPADRVRFRAVLGNIGAVPAPVTFHDPLADGAVLLPATRSATGGFFTDDEGAVAWSGEIAAGDSVVINYEAQLDPVRAEGKVFQFRAEAVGPIVGSLSRGATLPVFVPIEPGHFYVIDADADPLGTDRAPGAILKIDQRTGNTVPYYSNTDWRIPVDIAILGDTDPRLYVLDQNARAGDGGGRGVLWEIDPFTQTQTARVADPTWLRLESAVPISDTELLVVDSWADPFGLDPLPGPGAIYRVNPSAGTSVPVFSDTSWSRPMDIAVGASGRWLLLDADADPFGHGTAGGAVFSIDPVTGESQVRASSSFWSQPVGIDVDPDGRVWVVDQLATPFGFGRGSVWSFAEAGNAEPSLIGLSDVFARLFDIRFQTDGSALLVDGDARPGTSQTGVGAVFLFREGAIIPLAATSAMREPRKLAIYGDVTPIVELGLYARALETGIEVGWRGLSDRSDTRYFIYRQQREGPDLPAEIVLEDYEMVGAGEPFQGSGDHVFLDDGVEPSAWYAYLIAVVSPGGDVDTSRPILVQAPATVLRFALLPARPNPFGAATALAFQIPRAGDVDLELFDVGGRRVRRLVSGRMEAGIHRRDWDGRSDAGHPLASGIYFARLVWEGEERLQRIVRLR